MNELKKFKHLLIPLFFLLVGYFAVKTIWEKYETEKTELEASLEKKQQVIALFEKSKAMTEEFKNFKGKLFEGDYNTFFNRISLIASKNNVYVVSSRSVDVRLNRNQNEAESIIKDFAAEFLLESNYENIVGFINDISAIEEYVLLTGFDFSQVRESDGAVTVRAALTIAAKTMGKEDL